MFTNLKIGSIIIFFIEVQQDVQKDEVMSLEKKLKIRPLKNERKRRILEKKLGSEKEEEMKDMSAIVFISEN